MSNSNTFKPIACIMQHNISYIQDVLVVSTGRMLRLKDISERMV